MAGMYFITIGGIYMAYLLWFMQRTGRCDSVKLCDILIFIIVGNADSLGRVWWWEGGGQRTIWE